MHFGILKLILNLIEEPVFSNIRVFFVLMLLIIMLIEAVQVNVTFSVGQFPLMNTSVTKTVLPILYFITV